MRWGMAGFGKGDIWHRAHNAQNVVMQLKTIGVLDGADAICLESAVMIQNRQTVIDLAHVYGAIVAPLASPGVQVTRVPPITWQNYIGNKSFTKEEKAAVRKVTPGKSDSWYKEALRKERKQRTIRWVEKEFKIKVDSDDVADAIGVGYWRVNNG